MNIKYEGVSLNVEFVKSMTLKQFLKNEQMRVHFKQNEAVMTSAYRTITGKGGEAPAKDAVQDNSGSQVSE